ncbi:hypothetical protein [Cereibacter johrii]|uniref:hypothetical protein n=1 Tax=Cereibacter johrii TaxID=445629 RepID=UPI000DCD01DC|nr:hypothetical protein [Cereibacter johrii]RAZ82098.1 hypothetical protein DDV93_20855 [Cereibacter johrii]
MIFDDGGETSYGADITGDIDVEVRSGTVILRGMNTFTGATIISEDATLALDGQGRVSQSSGVAVNGTFDVSKASAATVNAISGAGVIEVGGKYLTSRPRPGASPAISAGPGASMSMRAS